MSTFSEIGTYYSEWRKPEKLSLWTRFLLLFCRRLVAIDWAGNETDNVLVFKKLRGKYYIVDEYPLGPWEELE